MSALEIYQWLVETQAGFGGVSNSCSSNCSFFWNGQPGCPGSSFTAMGAAFATQGYFAQADLLWQLTNTNMGLWAPLLYIFAALGGLISLALGMPPKMSLWFFMGPAIYQFLLGTTVPAYGTSWCIANFAQDQTEVWKLSEVGLRNSNIVARSRNGSGVFGPIEVFQYMEPSSPVEVSYLFLWFDGLISSTIQWMTVWTGVYQQRGGDNPASGIIEAPVGTDYVTNDQYYLMSNLKWSMLDRITSARLHNGDVRDAFVTFMSSECGDALARVVDPGLLIAASNSKTGSLPDSIFRGVVSTSTSAGGTTAGGSCRNRNVSRDYSPVTKALANRLVPLPRSIRRSWWNPDRSAGTGPVGGTSASLRGTLPGFYLGQSYQYPVPTIPTLGGFLGFLGSLFGGNPVAGASVFVGTGNQAAEQAIHGYLDREDNISCADYLFYVMNAFRWEAGSIYYQLVSTAPRNMTDEHVVYNLFYGWDLKDECGEKLSGEKLQNFLKDLVLLHLIRNEMSLAPKVADSRFMQQGAAAGNASNRYIAETGAKAKFGEVYSWALMMPYIQGVLLYLLAMAYPFVCVMIVVPGWHKTLFTWMAFWTWVKLWDLGFAVCIVLERSIWAAMGNSSVAANMSQKVAEMQRWGHVVVSQCSRESGGSCPPIPEVVDGMQGTGQELWTNLMAILDRSMLVGSSIDFDIQNGYYIYIMAALYFAVPAVTGQLVLGAKAGAAGMVSNLTQGAQSDGGRAASQAFTGNLRNTAAAASAAVGQESSAKAFRNQGLAARAIAAQNAQLAENLGASFAGSEAQGISNLQGIHRLNEGIRSNNLNTAGMIKKAGFAFSGVAIAGGNNGPTLNDIMGANPQQLQEAIDKSQPKPSQPGQEQNQSDRFGRVQASPLGASAVGAGPTGSGATGVDPNKLANAWTIGSGVYGGVQGLKNAAADAKVMMGQNAIVRGYAAQYSDMQAAAAGFGISQFGASARAQGYGMDAGRLERAASFGAESSAFEARRDYANQTSGYLSALGVDSSVVSPGNKPVEMMGMAMSGMLGSSAAAATRYAAPGGAYFDQASSAQGYLAQNYGASTLQGTFRDTSNPMQEWQRHDGVANVGWGIMNQGNDSVNIPRSGPDTAPGTSR